MKILQNCKRKFIVSKKSKLNQKIKMHFSNKKIIAKIGAKVVLCEAHACVLN